ncbi:MAG: ABC transporter permease subunit [Bacillota bacterium]|jgi:simple sugar transport system permease protein|nr:ABC transporter permease [Bacillota bacterium]NLH88334.1 ABC transporter permease [Bacillota bacterium]
MPEKTVSTAAKPAQARGKGGVKSLKQWSVPIFFLVLSIAGIIAAGLDINFLIHEITARFGRNMLLVLSLLIPVMAGLGLNFGIVIGAMAGQAALIIVTHYGVAGLPGFLLAAVISVPFAMLFGWLSGRILNQAKGREMVTSMIMGFFANGLYQLVFLVLVGTVIPMKNPVLMLSSGVGLRNTVDLIGLAGSLDRALDGLWNGFVMGEIGSIPIGPWRIPIFTIVVIVAFCLLLSFITKTKLGQEMRAVGQDMHIAQVAGINVDRTRMIAMILSTVLAAWGQLIFLQNIGTLNTYNSHEQVGMFSIAALLVGGASTKRATIWNAIVGVLLFHTLFVVSPLAGQRLMGIPQVGEYFRSFLAYGVIAVALALHAWQSKSENQ